METVRRRTYIDLEIERTDTVLLIAKALANIVKERVGKLQQFAKEKGADKLGGSSKVS